MLTPNLEASSPEAWPAGQPAEGDANIDTSSATCSPPCAPSRRPSMSTPPFKRRQMLLPPPLAKPAHVALEHVEVALVEARLTEPDSQSPCRAPASAARRAALAPESYPDLTTWQQEQSTPIHASLQRRYTMLFREGGKLGAGRSPLGQRRATSEQAPAVRTLFRDDDIKPLSGSASLPPLHLPLLRAAAATAAASRAAQTRCVGTQLSDT